MNVLFEDQAFAETAVGKDLYIVDVASIEINGEKIIVNDTILSKPD